MIRLSTLHEHAALVHSLTIAYCGDRNAKSPHHRIVLIFVAMRSAALSTRHEIAIVLGSLEEMEYVFAQQSRCSPYDRVVFGNRTIANPAESLTHESMTYALPLDTGVGMFSVLKSMTALSKVCP